MSSAPSATDGAGGGGLMDTLVANAQIVAGSGESSACERQCGKEQAALVACMDRIRAARESESSNVDSTNEASSGSVGGASGEVQCLAPVVAAWTTCCSDANNAQ